MACSAAAYLCWYHALARLGPYRVGATLYAMLAGQPPFKGTSVVNTLNAVLTRDPEPPSAVEPTVPAPLRAGGAD